MRSVASFAFRNLVDIVNRSRLESYYRLSFLALQMTYSVPLIALLAIASASQLASGSTLPTASIAAVQAAIPPKQDASFGDPIWATAARVGDFENVTTKTNATDSTTAMFLYDDKNVYVGFVAEQKSAPITTQSTNDVGYGLMIASRSLSIPAARIRANMRSRRRRAGSSTNTLRSLRAISYRGRSSRRSSERRTG